MNIRIVALCLAFTSAPAWAQSGGDHASAAAVRAAVLAKLQRGKQFEVRGEQYQQLPGVIAAERDSRSAPEETVAALGASPKDIIENKGRLVVFRAPQKASVAGAGIYSTALNTRTGTIGVLTGTFIVKPRSMADADAIAARHGLQKTKAYPKLQTVFYRVRAGADIADVSAALQADPMVASAYPEIIERLRTAK